MPCKRQEKNLFGASSLWVKYISKYVKRQWPCLVTAQSAVTSRYAIKSLSQWSEPKLVVKQSAAEEMAFFCCHFVVYPHFQFYNAWPLLSSVPMYIPEKQHFRHITLIILATLSGLSFVLHDGRMCIKYIYVFFLKIQRAFIPHFCIPKKS